MTAYQMAEILAENGIATPRGFADVERNGYESLACRQLSRTLSAALERCILCGMNSRSGFRPFKDTIEGLTDIMCRLSESGADRRLEKTARRAETLLARAADLVEAKGDDYMDLKGEVAKLIDNTLRGMRVIKITMSARVDKMQECEDTLLGIRARLGGVSDQSSELAAEKAAEIVACLREFRNDAHNRMFTVGSAEKLDRALRLSEEWAALRVKAGKNKRAGEAMLAQCQFPAGPDAPGADVMMLYAESEKVIDTLDNFASTLDEQEVQRTAAHLDGIEKLQAELSALEKARAAEVALMQCDKTAFDREQQALTARFQTGEIVKREFVDRCREVDRRRALAAETAADAQLKIEDIDDSIADRTRQLRDDQDMLAGYQGLFANLRRLHAGMLQYKKTDPAMLAMLGKDLDWDRIMRVVMGRASEADIEYVAHIDETVKNVEERGRTVIRDLNDRFRKRNVARVEERREQQRLRTERVARATPAARAGEDDDDYVAKMLNAFGAAENPPDEEEREAVRAQAPAEDR